MKPSRQERRKAERDAAKAPAKAGAAGAAAARARVHGNPVGDWTTQTEDAEVLFRTLGAEVVKQMADAGDRAAQYSLGYTLMDEVAGVASELGRAAKVDVGMDLCTETFPVAHTLTSPRCVDVVNRLITKRFVCGCPKRRRAWR